MDENFCILRLSIVLEADGQDQIQEVAALGGQDLDRTQRAADLQPDLLGVGVAQRIQQVAVVEADLHIIAFALGVEFIHHAAKVGLAADDDFTRSKTDAEGIFKRSVIIREARSMVSMNSLVSSVTRVRLPSGMTL